MNSIADGSVIIRTTSLVCPLRAALVRGSRSLEPASARRGPFLQSKSVSTLRSGVLASMR